MGRYIDNYITEKSTEFVSSFVFFADVISKVKAEKSILEGN